MNYNKHESTPTWVWWTFAVIFALVVLVALALNQAYHDSPPQGCNPDAYECIDAR